MPLPTLEQRSYYCERPIGRHPVMYQRWCNLLFLHWAIEPEVIQATLPDGLYVDSFEDRAYLAIVPFFMKGIRPRALPAVPGISNFLEVNLRTYVYDAKGRPGVWFYSLDANQWLAVHLARSLFHLPYYHARMSAKNDAGTIDYLSSRRTRAGSEESRFCYKPLEALPSVREDSLEFFLIERYLLFSIDTTHRQLYSGQVHHSPYPLFSVEVSKSDTTLATLSGFALESPEPEHMLFSPGVDVEVFSLERQNT